jgi:hypothetical protein
LRTGRLIAPGIWLLLRNAAKTGRCQRLLTDVRELKNRRAWVNNNAPRIQLAYVGIIAGAVAVGAAVVLTAAHLPIVPHTSISTEVIVGGN